MEGESKLRLRVVLGKIWHNGFPYQSFKAVLLYLRLAPHYFITVHWLVLYLAADVILQSYRLLITLADK